MLNLNQPAHLYFSWSLYQELVSVYESSVNTYLDISSTNAVVIYNNSAAIVVDADNVSDYYPLNNFPRRKEDKRF